MEKYAIIQLGGKQFKITEGLEFKVEHQDKLDIDVLLYSDGKTVDVGDPVVKNVSVKAKVAQEERAPKIRVARFKSKSRYRKVKGHKQPVSVVKIEGITKGVVPKASPASAEKKTSKTSKTSLKKGSTKSQKK